MLGTVLGIFGSFRPVVGEKTQAMANLCGWLSEALMPAAFGLALALLALWGCRCLSAQLAKFDSEMRNAILELPSQLASLVAYAPGPPRPDIV